MHISKLTTPQHLKPKRGDGLVARGTESPVLLLVCLLEVCVVLHMEALRYVDSEVRRQSRQHVADMGAICQSTADQLLPAREGLIIIPTIHPELSSLQNAVISDIVSGPYNCLHGGQNEDYDPHYTDDNPKVPDIKYLA